MNHQTSPRLGCAIAIAVTVCLGGCAAPKPIYAWGDYQNQVYDHLKGQGKGPEQQIIELEKDREQAAATGAASPPGYNAHLGLLYLNTGKTEQAVQLWNKEKALFPESSKYIDFLLNNMKKQKQGS